MISSLIVAVVIIIVDMTLMITYEFMTGLFFKLRSIEVPWVYKNFETHNFRAISAFSKTYFLTWLILAALKFVVIEFIIRGMIL